LAAAARHGIATKLTKRLVETIAPVERREAVIGHAWNKLTDQPWRIMTIGLRDWAHRY